MSQSFLTACRDACRWRLFLEACAAHVAARSVRP